jgi:protoporphyrinogen IX oxidase
LRDGADVLGAVRSKREAGVREFLTAAYPWTKAFHIIAMTAWMAGLFYLPRLFVYHAERADAPGETSELFKTMERRLLRAIMNPAMVATWALGLLLLATPGVVSWGSDLWIYPKLAAVAGLTWFHHWLGLRRKDFARDANAVSGRTYRMMNELPTLLLVIVVIMAAAKPF